MRVVVATDAWAPQVNGVVRTLGELRRLGPQMGLDVVFLTPDDFTTLPMPGYPEIRLSVLPRRGARAMLERFRPDAVHIATEGPIGLSMRSLCLKRGIPFTTSYHTRFPEYLRARLPIPMRLSYRWLRWFHNAGCGVMTATDSLDAELEKWGIGPRLRWSRGVDTALFHPRDASTFDLPRPIFLTVGRVAVEKNLDAFLALELPGSKLVVGDGPALASLQANYPDAVFLGGRSGEALAKVYAAADVFVFPSRTDTFGLVLLEALASGLPVAAYPVMGPRDIITSPKVGVLDEDLRYAALSAYGLERQACIDHGRSYSWEASIGQFAANMCSAIDRHRRSA